MVNHCELCKRDIATVGFFVGTHDAVVCMDCMNERQQIVMLAVIESLLVTRAGVSIPSSTDGKVH